MIASVLPCLFAPNSSLATYAAYQRGLRPKHPPRGALAAPQEGDTPQGVPLRRGAHRILLVGGAWHGNCRRMQCPLHIKHRIHQVHERPLVQVRWGVDNDTHIHTHAHTTFFVFCGVLQSNHTATQSHANPPPPPPPSFPTHSGPATTPRTTPTTNWSTGQSSYGLCIGIGQTIVEHYLRGSCSRRGTTWCYECCQASTHGFR